MIKNYTHYNIGMNIVLNGQPTALSGPMTVAALIDQLGFTGKRIAVERNGEIVPKSAYLQVCISEGDRIEIVVAVGGG
jgi:sulfur carrier protein